MPPGNAKPVKDEVETDDEKPISQVRDKTKKKPSTPTTISKQHSKVKKEEPQESGSNLKKPSKPTPKQAKPKKEEEPKHDDKKNVKRKREEEKGNADVKKRERKVYDLPGQKRDPPEEVNLPFFCVWFLVIYIGYGWSNLWLWNIFVPCRETL